MNNRIKILVWLCLFNYYSKAQQNEDVKLKVRKSNQSIGVELPNLNVLYRGIENPMRIVYAGNCKLVVKINCGIVVNKNDGNYAVFVNEGKEVAINIFEERGKKLTHIGTKKYRVKSVPDPIPLFSGKKNGEEISKALLIAGGGLTVSLNDFLYDVKYEVVSFSISVNIIGEFKTESAIGNLTNGSQYALLGKLKNGTRVIIEDIIVKQVGEGCPNIKLPSIMLKVNG